MESFWGSGLLHPQSWVLGFFILVPTGTVTVQGGVVFAMLMTEGCDFYDVNGFLE